MCREDAHYSLPLPVVPGKDILTRSIRSPEKDL